MTSADDGKRFHLRDEALGAEVARQNAGPPIGVPSMLARTKVLSKYPTQAVSFYGCQPQTLFGSEVEGGAGVVSGPDVTYLALNLGTGIPPAGTLVLTTFVGNRWVFRYDA